MAPTRHPLIDLVFNDETGRYIAHLERKITWYQLQDLRFRALLELLTGDDWDDYSFLNTEDEEIKRLAVDALMRRLQMSASDARKLVSQRWDKHNPPPENALIDGKLFAGPMPGETAMPHNVTVARPIAAGMTVGYDHKKHLAGLERAAKNREGMRVEGQLGHKP